MVDVQTTAGNLDEAGKLYKNKWGQLNMVDEVVEVVKKLADVSWKWSGEDWLAISSALGLEKKSK